MIVPPAISLKFNKDTSKCIYFPQSLLSINYNSSLPIQNTVSNDDTQTWFIRPPYTEQQINFHNYIDKLSNIMNPYVLGVPQLCRSQAQDVHKLIMGLGKFMNSTSKKFIFKNNNIDTQDTLQKLNVLQFNLIKYCNTKLPNNTIIKEHCEELHLHLQTTINFIKKKTAFQKNTLLTILNASEYFIERKI